MNLQYSIDGATSWTTYSTIEESNHTPSTACVTVSSTIVGANVPAASNFAWRLDGTWSSGDYYFYVDNFLAVEDCVCVPPNNVIASLIEENSITIGWDQFGTITTGWNVEYGLAGFTQGSGTLLTVTSQEALVGGLDPNTEYDFYVQGDCSADQSTWTGPSTFTTACSLTSATFTEDFDAVSTPEVPNCWTAIAVGANQFVRCRTITTANPNSGPNHVEMYNSATNGAAEHVMLVGPGVNDLSSGSNQLRFFAKRGTNAVDLEVGTMSDPSDPTTFTLLTTISNLTTTHEQFIVTFDNYTGTDEYFVFKHANTAATQYVYIDDVIWEPIPSCPLPSNLEATNITLTEADLSWVDNAGASQWEVEWGAEGFVLGNGTNSTETTTNLSLTGLTDGTTYEFYVRADCGGDFSDWEGPIAFSTAISCEDIFFDNGGASSEYLPNSDEIYKICPENIGDYVKITFNSFITEDSLDGIYVFDGPDINSPLIPSSNGPGNSTVLSMPGAYWGDSVPGPFESTSPGGCLTLHFLSDGSTQLDGFEVEVECFGCSPTPGEGNEIDVCRLDDTLDLNLHVLKGTADDSSISGQWLFPAFPGFLFDDTLLLVTFLPPDLYSAFYVIQTPCGIDTTTLEFTIYPPSSAGENGTVSVCRNQPVNLFEALTGNADLGGQWYDPSGNPIS